MPISEDNVKQIKKIQKLAKEVHIAGFWNGRESAVKIAREVNNPSSSQVQRFAEEHLGIVEYDITPTDLRRK